MAEELPVTGASPWQALGVGTATMATGAAAIAAAHRLKARSSASGPATEVVGSGSTPD